MENKDNFKSILYKIICIWIIWGMLLWGVPIPMIQTSSDVHAFILEDIYGIYFDPGTGTASDTRPGHRTSDDDGFGVGDGIGEAGPVAGIEPGFDDSFSDFEADYDFPTGTKGQITQSYNLDLNINQIETRTLDLLNNTYEIGIYTHISDLDKLPDFDNDGVIDNYDVMVGEWVLTDTQTFQVRDVYTLDNGDINFTKVDVDGEEEDVTWNQATGEFEKSEERKSEVSAISRYFEQNDIKGAIQFADGSYGYRDADGNIHTVEVNDSGEIVDTIFHSSTLSLKYTYENSAGEIIEENLLDQRAANKLWELLRNADFGSIVEVQAERTVKTFEDLDDIGFGPKFIEEGVEENSKGIFLKKVEKDTYVDFVIVDENGLNRDDSSLTTRAKYTYLDRNNNGVIDTWKDADNNVFRIRDGLLVEDADGNNYDYNFDDQGNVTGVLQWNEENWNLYTPQSDGKIEDLRGKVGSNLLENPRNPKVSLSDNNVKILAEFFDRAITGDINLDDRLFLAEILVSGRVKIKDEDKILVYRVNDKGELIEEDGKNIVQAEFKLDNDKNIESYEYVKGNNYVVKHEGEDVITRDLIKMKYYLGGIRFSELLESFSINSLDINSLEYSRVADRVIFTTDIEGKEYKMFANYLEGDVEYAGYWIKDNKLMSIFVGLGSEIPVAEFCTDNSNFKGDFDINTFKYIYSDDISERRIETYDEDGIKLNTYKIQDSDQIELVREDSTLPNYRPGQRDAIAEILRKLGIDYDINNVREIGNRFVYTDGNRSVAIDLRNFKLNQEFLATVYDVTIGDNSSFQKVTYALTCINIGGDNFNVIPRELENNEIDFDSNIVSRLEQIGLSAEDIAVNIDITENKNDPDDNDKVTGYTLKINNFTVSDTDDSNKIDVKITTYENRTMKTFVERLKDHNNNIEKISFYDAGQRKSITLSKEQINQLTGITGISEDSLFDAELDTARNELIVGNFVISLNEENNNIEVKGVYKIHDNNVSFYTQNSEGNWTDSNEVQVRSNWLGAMLEREGLGELNEDNIRRLLTDYELIGDEIDGEFTANAVRINGENSNFIYVKNDDYLFEHVKRPRGSLEEGLYLRTASNQIGRAVINDKVVRRITDNQLTKMAGEIGLTVSELINQIRRGQDNELIIDRTKILENDPSGNHRKGIKYTFRLAHNISQGSRYDISLITTDYTNKEILLNSNIMDPNNTILRLTEGIMKNILGITNDGEDAFTTRSIDRIIEGLKAHNSDWIYGDSDNAFKFHHNGNDWMAIEAVKDGRDIIVRNDISDWDATRKITSNLIWGSINSAEEILKLISVDLDNNTVMRRDAEDDLKATVYKLAATTDEVYREVDMIIEIDANDDGGIIVKDASEEDIFNIDYDGMMRLADVLDFAEGIQDSIRSSDLQSFAGSIVGVRNQSDGSFIIATDGTNFKFFEVNTEESTITADSSNNPLVISQEGWISIQEAVERQDEDIDNASEVGFDYDGLDIDISGNTVTVPTVFEEDGEERIGYEGLVFRFSEDGKLISVPQDPEVTQAGLAFNRLNEQLSIVNADPIEWSAFKIGWDNNAKTMEDHDIPDELSDIWGDDDNNEYYKVRTNNRLSGQTIIDVYFDEEGNITYNINYHLRLGQDGEFERNDDGQLIIDSILMLRYDWDQDNSNRASISGKRLGQNNTVIGEVREGSEVTITDDGVKIDIVIDGKSGNPTVTLKVTQTRDQITHIQTEAHETNPNNWWTTRTTERTYNRDGDDGDWTYAQGDSLVRTSSDGDDSIEITYNFDEDGKSRSRTIVDNIGGQTATATETIEDGCFFDVVARRQVTIDGHRIVDGERVDMSGTVTREWFVGVQNGEEVEWSMIQVEGRRAYKDTYSATPEQIQENAEGRLGQFADEFLARLGQSREAAINYLAGVLLDNVDRITDADTAREEAIGLLSIIMTGQTATYDFETGKLLSIEETEIPESQTPETGPGGGSPTGTGEGAHDGGEGTQPESPWSNPDHAARELGSNLKNSAARFAELPFEERLAKAGINPNDIANIMNITDELSKIAKIEYLRAMGVRGDLAEKLAGMSDEEATAFLRALGFTDEEIEEFLALDSDAAKKMFLKEHGFSDEEISKILAMTDEEQREYLENRGFMNDEIERFLGLTREDAIEYFLQNSGKFDLTEEQMEKFQELFGEGSTATMSERRAFLTGLGLTKEQAQEILSMTNENDIRAYLNNISFSDEQIEGYMELVAEGVSDEVKRAYLEAIGLKDEDINSILSLTDENEISNALENMSKFTDEQIEKLLSLPTSFRESYLMGLGLSDSQADEVINARKEDEQAKYLIGLGIPSWLANYIIDPKDSENSANMDKVIDLLVEVAEELDLTGMLKEAGVDFDFGRVIEELTPGDELDSGQDTLSTQDYGRTQTSYTIKDDVPEGVWSRKDQNESIYTDETDTSRDNTAKIEEAERKSEEIIGNIASVLWDAILTGMQVDGEKMWLSPDSSKEQAKRFLTAVIEKAGYTVPSGSRTERTTPPVREDDPIVTIPTPPRPPERLPGDDILDAQSIPDVPELEELEEYLSSYSEIYSIVW